MLARSPRLGWTTLAVALLGATAPEARASGIQYNVTNLGVMTPVALNDAGQVALNQSTAFGYADPISDDGSAEARHISQSSFTHAVLYTGYGPNAGSQYVGQILPAATSDPNGLNSVTNLQGVTIAKPETSDFATGITASGQVAVTSAAGSFLTDGKTYLPIPSAPAVQDPFPRDGMTVVNSGIGPHGVDVGTALAPDAPYVPGGHGTYNPGQHAFLYDGTKLIDLNSEISNQLNITLNNAIAINGSGQILAEGYGGSNDVENAFLLTPVGMPIPVTPTLAPEPGTLAIFGLAAGAAWLRRRQRAARAGKAG